MISALHIITSQSKMKIVKILHFRSTPDEIASELEMTRQAVDKNIKDLLKFGIVSRTWKTGSRRPRVEFHLSDMGKELYSNLEKLMHEYKADGNTAVTQMLKDLDVALINGKITAERYVEIMDEIKDQFRWFLDPP